MKDSILCAIDFSESSVNAMRWAVQLAECSQAHLTALFSYRLIQTGKPEGLMAFKKKTEEEAMKKYHDLETTIINGHPVSRGLVTEIGFYSDNIESYIRKNRVTMVVISQSLCDSIFSHKGQSVHDFIESIKVPLLIVPNQHEKGFVAHRTIAAG